MKRHIYGICFVVLAALSASCEAAMDFLEQPPHKTIIVSDSDPDYPARIKDINNKTILLALTTIRPVPQDINMEELLNSVYTIGKVTRNKISLKLYHGGIDYWRDGGDYWVVFVLPDGRAEHISWAYVSKQPHNFYAENTYLNNIDFMPPIDINLDTSGYLPF
ncbi:MAG: hypothetical protein LBH18_02000 [Spirochaetaceae bacterium]|jgi:hypothetical protein|nr:hypothetical protein [Spirochaetaceae bacterium]